MKVLAVLAIISLAFIDGRNVKGRNKRRFYLYCYNSFNLAMVGMHILYYQPLVLTKLVIIVFRPITEPLILFLRSL